MAKVWHLRLFNSCMIYENILKVLRLSWINLKVSDWYRADHKSINNSKETSL